jgi:hypothetical protein
MHFGIIIENFQHWFKGLVNFHHCCRWRGGHYDDRDIDVALATIPGGTPA